MKQIEPKRVGMALAALALAACGPKALTIKPSQVVDLKVRPASGQLLFCPGDPTELEVLARLSDGSTCSSIDGERVCLGEKGVIRPDFVHIEASAGGFDPSRPYVLVPPGDPLATAQEGVSLRAWLEAVPAEGGGKSMVGDATLRPVYQCAGQSAAVYQGADGPFAGADGAPGPDLDVAITTLSTPFHPNAALVRVRAGETVRYLVSASADQPVTVVTRGGAGAIGAMGAAGARGVAGKPSEIECGPGTNGQDGAPGGPGGRGGTGGAGGRIRVFVDDGAVQKLLGRLRLASEGGPPGAGGYGGPGGPGGDAGAPGPKGAACQAEALGARDAKPGAAGPAGANGPPGAPGPSGPAPDTIPAARPRLFERELPRVMAIEAAPAKP